MFQKLRKKFIFIAMFSVTVVLIGILAIINIFYYLQINNSSEQVLKYLAFNNGKFPEKSYSYGNSDLPFSLETPYQTRYFTITYNTDDDTTTINMGHVAAILPSEAYNYGQQIFRSGKKEGFYKNYKFLVVDTKDGYLAIFLDWSTEIQSMSFLAMTSLLILGVSLVIIFILISLWSKPIIEPVINNVKKQRQFITDASHEIKTPLAIISADTDVIEILHGKDEWTESIKEQIRRLNELIKGMLTLSKMDSDMPKDIIKEFNLSKTVNEMADDFKPIAINEKKNYTINVEPDIKFSGNEEGVKQLISVLLNNAFKYTDDQGNITLNIRKKGKSVIVDLLNTTDSMPEGDLQKLFDRFYRADSSRSRETGSYGIGLSIAQAVVQQHKGTIVAEKVNDNTILFQAILNAI